MHPLDFFLNFFRPWSVEVHSGFGAASLLGLVFGTVGILVVQSGRRYWWIVPLVALPYAYATGTKGYIFEFFFNYVPLFKNIRVPGRILSVAPVILLAAIVCLRQANARINLKQAIRISALVNGIFLLGFVAYQFKFPGNGWRGGPFRDLSPENLVPVWGFARQLSWILLGLAASVAFWICAVAKEKTRALQIAVGVLGLATFAQTALILRHSTWVVDAVPSASIEDFEKIDHLQFYGSLPLISINSLEETTYGTATTQYTDFIKAAGVKASCYLPVDEELRKNGGLLLPFYLSDQTICHKNQAEVLDYLRTQACPAEGGVVTLLSEGVSGDCALGVSGAASGSKRSLVELNRANRIIALTPNLLTLETDAARDAILVTPFSFATKNWRALVDGAEVPLVQTNGAFVGLKVPAGLHLVRIEYFSERFLLGYRIAFGAALALALLALAAAAIRAKRPARQTALAGAFLVLALTGAYVLWERGIAADARREVLLHNTYPELLERQLKRWETPESQD